jgi:hypothetical protein
MRLQRGLLKDTPDGAIADAPVACRFTEAGEFTGGQWQGAELEIIQSGSTDLPAAVTLVLKRGAEEVQRVEAKQVVLRPDSNTRWRVAGPLAAGHYSVEYDVQAAGVRVARGKFGFEAGGPLRVELAPFFLWREGIFVRVEVPGHKTTDVRVRLLDSAGRKTSHESLFRTGTDGKGEGFLSVRGVRPGPCLVRVEVREGGQPVASQGIAWLGICPFRW